MALSTTEGLLTGQLIKALGNTLIYSLWQGVLLAAGGGLIIVFTKKLSATLRYNLLLGALVLFTCGTAVTFIEQLQSSQKSALVYVADRALTTIQTHQYDVISPANFEAKQNPVDLLTSFLNAHADTIVLIWFLIICIKSIKLVVGGYEVYQLKHSKIYSVSHYWDNRITYLADQLKIRQAVSLLESGIAKVPMVIGHLKPVILIPIGFINALSSDEVEAILIHELAHIRRRDYLVNLLQKLSGGGVLFNPAVIWVSQLIKAERENCCDDIALGQAGNKSNYINALLSCQEYQAPDLGMALANNKNTLLNRVKRIVNNHNQSLNIMEKTLLTICLVTAGLLTVAFSAKDTVNTTVKKNNVQQSATVVTHVVGTKAKVNTGKVDTPVNSREKIYKPSEISDGSTIRMSDRKNGKGHDVFLVRRHGEMYQLFIENNKVTRLYINGEAAPIAQYSSKVDALMAEYKKLEKTPVPPVPPAPVTGALIAPPHAIASVRAPKAIAMTGPVAPTPPVPMVATVSKPSVPAVPATPAAVAMVGPAGPVPPLPPKGIESDALYNRMTDKLIQKGIIDDKNNVDISISNEELKVNGVKQPEELHQEILKMYVTHPGDKVTWSYSSHN